MTGLRLGPLCSWRLKRTTESAKGCRGNTQDNDLVSLTNQRQDANKEEGGSKQGATGRHPNAIHLLEAEVK